MKKVLGFFVVILTLIICSCSGKSNVFGRWRLETTNTGNGNSLLVELKPNGEMIFYYPDDTICGKTKVKVLSPNEAFFSGYDEGKNPLIFHAVYANGKLVLKNPADKESSYTLIRMPSIEIFNAEKLCDHPVFIDSLEKEILMTAEQDTVKIEFQITKIYGLTDSRKWIAESFCGPSGKETGCIFIFAPSGLYDLNVIGTAKYYSANGRIHEKTFDITTGSRYWRMTPQILEKIREKIAPPEPIHKKSSSRGSAAAKT